jgi:hypothetical protein
MHGSDELTQAQDSQDDKWVDPTCCAVWLNETAYAMNAYGGLQCTILNTEVPLFPPDSNVSLALFPAAAVFNSSDGETIYVAYPSADKDSTLKYVTFDGKKWSSETAIPGVLTDWSPALAVWEEDGENKLLYVFHQGSDKTNTANTLWYTTFDGTNWATDTQVPGVWLDNSPAAVFYNGALYVVHQGSWRTGTSGTLWYTVFDGKQWSADRPIPNVSSASGSPSVVASKFVGDGDDAKLVVAYRDSTDGFWLEVMTGTQWDKFPFNMTVFPGLHLDPAASPALLASGDGEPILVITNTYGNPTPFQYDPN